MMFKKFSAFILAIILMLLTGCYDNNEIDTFANVVAVGVEKDGDSAKFSFAVADVSGFSSDGDNGSKSALICYTEKSKSITDAIKNINKKLSKKLSFSHMTIIIISKEYAKNGIQNLAQYFEQDYDVRPQTLVALSEFEPSEYLEKISPILEVNAEKYFLGIFQNNSENISPLRLSDYTDAFYCNKSIAAPLMNGDLSEDEVKEEQIIVSDKVILKPNK